MYLLKISDLRPGMILDEDIFSMDENLIASEGTILSAHLIRHLEVYGVFIANVKSIYPEDDRPKMNNNHH